MKRLFLLIVLLCVFLSAGCSPDAGAGTVADTTPSATPVKTSNAESTEPTSFPMAILDWADTVKFGGITYLATDDGVGRPLKEEDLGPKFAQVQHKLQDNVNDLAYETKNGDAGFLEPGTPVYEVRGYDPSFRLAAYDAYGGKTLTLYEVMVNPKAEEASDYLDIEGKVRYIGVNGPRSASTELASIRNPKKVRSLVGMIMKAPLQAEPGSFGDENAKVYFLAFHLEDGTASVQTYYADEGKMYFGITLPEEFRRTIERSVREGVS